MGWGDCGTDSKGRNIGYVWDATCDHPDCAAQIDRGLSYACGGMHGSSDGCEGYFCGDHLSYHADGQGEYRQFCEACTKVYMEAYLDDCISVAKQVGVEVSPGDDAETIHAEIIESANEDDLSPDDRATIYDLCSNWDEFYGLEPADDMPDHIKKRVDHMMQIRNEYNEHRI